MAVGYGADDSGDVFGRPHPALRQQARGDALFVDLFDFGDHVRAYDARLDLENKDAFWGEALGIDHARHAETRLRDAVFRTIYGCREGGDGRNKYDTARSPFQHPA